MKPTLHPYEDDRLRELRRYGILDTDQEPEFDELVEIAAEICETPVSVVNFIDKGRQWFKAEVGLGVRSTPLETSLCGHVILQGDFVEIPDTLADIRMADNPLCTSEPGFASTSSVRSSTRWKSDTQRSSARSWRATSAGVK